LGREFFEEADEKTGHSLIGGLLGLRSGFADEMFSNSFLSNEILFKIQSDVIREIAEQQSAVFVGRCADYVLKDHPRCLNLFISADMNDRVKRISKIQQLTESKANDYIEKMDKKRASYYNYYSNKVWGAAGSYHLCINSSFLGIDETVIFLGAFAKKRFGV
jgi:cytidylate kinase